MERTRPALCEKGHVSVVSVVFPPAAGGSSVIMANLLKYFDPSSVSVLGAKWPNEKIKLTDLDIQRDIVYTRQAHSWKLNKIKEQFERGKVVKRIINKVKENRSVAIVAVYPDLFLFECALAASEKLDLPFIPYLHDTVVETQESEGARKRAEDVQRRYLARSSQIFVMSDGMKNLFKRKYDRDASMKRVADACKSLGQKLKIATNKDLSYHSNLGLDPESIELVYYPNRTKYLQALSDTKILILGLSWPEETSIHFDEMSTIFPTKTCEYLASGSQILVHCPKDYFLAEFFNEKQCARFIGDRDQSAIENTLAEMLAADDDGPLVKSALSAATQFSVSKVAPVFKEIVDNVVG